MTGIASGKTWSRIGPEVAPTSSAASGVWTLQEYSENQGAGTWPNPKLGWVAWYEPVYNSNSSYGIIQNGISIDVDSNDNVAIQFAQSDETQSPTFRYITVAYINGATETQTWVRNQGVNSSTTTLQKYLSVSSHSLIFDSSDEVVIAVSSISLNSNDGWKYVTSAEAPRGFVLMNWNKTNGNQLNYSKIILKETDNAYTTGAICKGAQTSSTIFSSMWENDSATMAIYQTAKSNGAHVSTQTWNSPSGGGGMVNGGGGNNGYAVGAGYAWTAHGGASQAYHATFVTNVPGSTANGDNYNLYQTAAGSATTYGEDATWDGSNMYCAVSNGGSISSSTIVKINTSTDAITWQQSYKGTGASGQSYPRSICVDASGNTYMVGYCYATVSESGYNGIHTWIIKHNSAGVRQWTRMLDFQAKGSVNDNQPNDISIDAAGEFIYVSIYAYVISGGAVASNLAVAVKLATDGSGTGTTTTTGDITTVYYYDAATYLISGFTSAAGALSVQEGYMYDSSTDYLQLTDTGLPQTNTTPTPRPTNLAKI